MKPLVEIYQGDRVSAEDEGAPKAAHQGNPASAPGGFRPQGYVWNAWAKGYKLGLQASSDHLSNHISDACTLAADPSRESLLDAMRLRHSYGATDNIILDCRLETGGKEYLQGDIVPTRQPFLLRVKVIGTAPIQQIEIIRSQKFIHTRQPLKTEDAFTFGAWLQIRSANLLDQILDLGAIGSRNLFTLGHFRSLTFTFGNDNHFDQP